MYILAFHILWDNILGRYFGMKIDFQIFHSKFFLALKMPMVSKEGQIDW